MMTNDNHVANRKSNSWIFSISDFYGQMLKEKAKHISGMFSGICSTQGSKMMLLLIQMLQVHWLMQSATGKWKWLNFSSKIAQVWIQLAAIWKLLCISLWFLNFCFFKMVHLWMPRQDKSNWRTFDEETNDCLQNNDCVYLILK